jgi:hypothetical protein
VSTALPAGDRRDGSEGLDGSAEDRDAAGVVELLLRLGRRLAGGQRDVDRQDLRPVLRGPQQLIGHFACRLDL